MTYFANQILARSVRATLVVAILILAVVPGAVMADDWVAERLRGNVFVLTAGQWVPLERGAVVSDASPIQSTASGRATFTRDNESITIAGDTIIQIVDLATSGLSNTVVHQRSGMVTVEADVRQVQHFSVETPFLAAVVKGTIFSVRIENAGAEVNVSRGRVEVRDGATDASVEIVPGQSAGNVGGGPLVFKGPGGNEIVVSSQNANGNGNAGNNGLALGVGGGNAGGNGVGLALGVGGGNGVSLALEVGGGTPGGNGVGLALGLGNGKVLGLGLGT